MRRFVLGWKKLGLECRLGTRLVTYADDLVILCRKGNAEEALQRYDRLVRYEAEDLTKLVGAVAESWEVGKDNKTFTFKLRPNQKFESGAVVTADDVAWSLQRVVLMDKTPAFLFNQLGWKKDNVKDLIKAVDASTLQFKIVEDFSPVMVLNLMATTAGSVVERKVALANEERRHGQRVAQDPLGQLRRLQADFLEGERKSMLWCASPRC